MSYKTAKKIIPLIIAASAGFSSSVLFAQDSAPETPEQMAEKDSTLAIEEVVVTARKGQAENLQIVPIAINAISEQTIEEKGINGIEDMTKLVSGLSFDAGILPNDTRPTIRGLSTTRGRSNVATLVDYVDVSSESLVTAGGGMTANMRLTDLARVEVIKGPQTVMYGRSAFSGAVNYVTKRPDMEEFHGNVDADISTIDSESPNLNAADLKLGLTGPISETLGYRLNLAQSDSDGWYDNPNTGGDLGTEDTLGGAFALLFQPNDVFSSYSRVEYSDEEYNPRAQVFVSTVDHEPVLGDYTGTSDSALDPGPSQNPVGYDDGREVFYNHGHFRNSKNVRNAPAAFNADGSPKVNCSTDQVPFRNRNPLTDGFEATGNNAYCRPQLVGSFDANESMIDLSADPRTGKDFTGTEVDNLRLHEELAWNFEDFEFKSISAYTKNESRIQEDFDLTDYALYGGTQDSNGNYETLYNPNAPLTKEIDDDNNPNTPPITVPATNCNGQLRAGIPYETAGAGECIAQYGFQTAMDLRYDLEQYSQEFRFAGQGEHFDWFTSVLLWKEQLGTKMNDKWWMREGGNDLINSPFVAPGQAGVSPPSGGAVGLPYLDANHDGLNDARDCLGADRGDVSKGCYASARSIDQTNPYVDKLTRDTDHFSIAPSLTWHTTDTVDMTAEVRYIREQLKYTGSGSQLHGLSSAFGNCGGFMVPYGIYPIDPSDINGNGSTNEPLNSGADGAGGAGALVPDVQGQCEDQSNSLSTIEEYIPRFNVTWNMSDDVMFYGTYAEGFKPGGVDTTNAGSQVLPTDNDHETVVRDDPVDANGDGDINEADYVLPENRVAGNFKEYQPEYDPEKLKTIEFGTKTQLFDGRIIWNASAFFYKYTQQQLSLLIKLGSTGLVAPTTVNAGESRVKGFETDFTMRLTESLTWNIGYTYSDAYYEDFNLSNIAQDRFGDLGADAIIGGGSTADAGNAEGDFSGNQLPFSPKNSITTNLRYDTELSDAWSGFAELNGNYQSKRYMSAGNNDYLEAYDIWGITTGVSNESWLVTFYIDNVFNDDTIRSGVNNTDYGFGVSYEFDLAQGANLVLPQPRTYGLRASYKF